MLYSKKKNKNKSYVLKVKEKMLKVNQTALQAVKYLFTCIYYYVTLMT